MPPRASRPAEHGAALLVAIVAIAILSALTVDLAYETQVRLRIATNARDELRAEALAQSAVTVSRLVLGFQAQIDQALATATAPAAGGAAAPALALPRPQLWKLVPVSSALTQSLFGGAGAASPAGKAKEPSPGDQPVVASASYGDFAGGFQARIEDEGQKINVQLDSSVADGVLETQVEALLRMFCDAKWDGLFDRTDADGQRYSRTDLLLHLVDWVDEDAIASASKISFPGGNCSFVVPPSPFEKAFSDENFPYDRGPDRYRAKNSRMDSLEELYLVAGVTDAFLAAFGDQLTAYLPKSAQMNVNSDDLPGQLRIARAMVDPGSYGQLGDPNVQGRFHQGLSQLSANGALSITFAGYQQVLQGLGLKLRSDLAVVQKAFTDRSLVFRIHAFGVAGDVTHDTEAVVSFDPNQGTPAERTARAAAAAAGRLDMGQLIHWREE